MINSDRLILIGAESELIGALTKQIYKVESQMQKAQSDLKRSEEQIRLKDQEIYKMKRKVPHLYFLLSLVEILLRKSKFQIHTDQGLGDQEQEPGEFAKEGAATATSSSRPVGISLQKMSDARTENLRDGG